MTSRLPWCGFRPPRNDPGQNRCRITTQTKATDTVMAQVFSGGSGNPFAGALTLYGRPSTAPARKRPPCQRGHRRSNKNPELVAQPLHRLNPAAFDLVILRGQGSHQRFQQDKVAGPGPKRRRGFRGHQQDVVGISAHWGGGTVRQQHRRHVALVKEPQDRFNHSGMPVEHGCQQDGVVRKVNELMGHPVG